MIFRVDLTPKAEKDLLRLPIHIKRKLLVWIKSINEDGLENVRKIPGFHDEPLVGTRKGQRSVRLNRSYRAIYTVSPSPTVLIEEINKHDY